MLDSTDPAQVKALEKQDRSGPHAVHRLEQVRQHAGAEHLQAVLLRAGPAERWAPEKRAAASSPSPTPARRCSRSPRAMASAASSSACRASAGATRRSPTSAWCRRRSWASTCRASWIRPRRWCTPARPTVPAEENPGVVLGTILGVLATSGRDKVTIITSPGIRDLGAWLEQLLAESTGKEGKGLIPVDREPLGAPDVYGNDRLFAYLRLESTPDAAQESGGGGAGRGGQPVVRIGLTDAYQLGAEFFRWEIATAVAGSILGIHPFNQPDVEASKVATRKLTAEYEKTGSLPAETPIFDGRRHQAVHRREERRGADDRRRAASRRWRRISRRIWTDLGAGDYFALLAYIEMNEAHERPLQAMRLAVRDAQARGDVPRLRPALPALDGPGLQGRAQHRRVPADHLRRRGGSARPRPEIHLRRREGGAGARRFPGAGGARPPRAARPSRPGCRAPAWRRCERPSPSKRWHRKEGIMPIHPSAGTPAQPSMLVNIPRLVTAYYTERPDPTVPEQRVAFGTSGHRGSAFACAFNEAHILAMTQAICRYRQQHHIDGPLFLGMDTHALSEPAFATALEVLAGNSVEAMIDSQGGYTPTPAISHAILTYNRGRTSGLADGIVITPSHNPPEDGGFKYNPPHGGPAETPVTAWIEPEANRVAGRRPARRVTHSLRARPRLLHHTCRRLHRLVCRRPQRGGRHGGDPPRQAPPRRRSPGWVRAWPTGRRSSSAMASTCRWSTTPSTPPSAS